MTTLANDFRRVGILLLATVLVVGLVAVLVLATETILLIFLGILFGILLVKLSDKLKGRVSLSYAWRLAIVTILLAMATVLAVISLAGVIEKRLSNLSERLDQSTEIANEWLGAYPTARGILGGVPLLGDALREDATGRQSEGDGRRPDGSPEGEGGGPSDNADTRKKENAGRDIANAAGELAKPVGGRIFSAIKRTIASSLGLIVNVWLVIFIALFVAASPDTYRMGFARLFPISHRDRVCEVMGKMGDDLFNWLIGRFATMAITGAGTALALWVIGVPLPFTIGVVTGILAFIPNIGAYVSGALAVLVAVPLGGAAVGWVLLAYTGVQMLESYIATPLIQQRLTSVPPALLLGFQFIMGALAGIIGLLVATPLLAAGKVLVTQVWIKDALGDEAVE